MSRSAVLHVSWPTIGLSALLMSACLASIGYIGRLQSNLGVSLRTDVAVDTLANLLAVVVTPANEQERAQVATMAERVQVVTGQTVEVAFVDQGYTGEAAAEQAKAHGIRLGVVKHTEAKKGFVLLPRRWVVERSFGWLGRFRRLARDYERLAKVLAGWHWVAFLSLLLKQVGLESSLQALTAR